jgi:hypothetical protein
MNNNRIIEIFEALLDGYSPTTGESLEDNIILNDREIIRALTTIVLKLKETPSSHERAVSKIDSDDFLIAIKAFERYNVNVTENRLRKFFSGRSLNEKLNSHELFGKYEDSLTSKAVYMSIKELFSNFRNNPSKKRKVKEWSNILFPEGEIFNSLSSYELELYKNSINELGIVKSEDLSVYIIDARRNFKRAYEPWLEKENQILNEVIEKTNDLEVLSEIFQRGRRGIESQAKKLIYFKQEGNAPIAP